MAAIRFGLIGMGRHGMRYAQHLMRHVEGAELYIPSLTLDGPCILTMAPQERAP